MDPLGIEMYVMLVCQNRNFITDFTVYNVARTGGRGVGVTGGLTLTYLELVF